MVRAKNGAYNVFDGVNVKVLAEIHANARVESLNTAFNKFFDESYNKWFREAIKEAYGRFHRRV